MREHEHGERRAFVGISTGSAESHASLADALQDAAEHAVRNGAVTKEESVWYDLVLSVEVANQHIKTFRAGLVPQR